MLLHTETQGLFHCSDFRDMGVAFRTLELPEIFIFAAIYGHWHLSKWLMERMPSWVPDWSRARDSIPLYWPMSAPAFNAAKGYNHEPMENEENWVLRVRGKQVDIVRTLVDHRFEELREATTRPSYDCSTDCDVLFIFLLYYRYYCRTPTRRNLLRFIDFHVNPL